MISEGLFRLEALQELANIGGGNAATSLSKLVGKPIQMTIPTVEEMAYEKVFQTLRSEEEVVKAVMMELRGNAGGVFLFVMSEESAADWAGLLFNGEEQSSNELIESALKELVNILVHSFLNAVIQILGVNLLSSVPIMMEDMFGSILSSLYMEQEQYDDQVIILKNAFYCEGDQIEGSLYFVPKPGVLETLVTLLGV